MSSLAHKITALPEDFGFENRITDQIPLASVHPASDASVQTVLNKSTEGMDGRSNWCWIRLADGTLILGIFPQGDTYLSVEDDAIYPGD